ncbi:hypothetical protein Gpo141_00004246 [Globisporangium polare]
MSPFLSCSRRSDSSAEPSSPRGLRKLFRRLRSKRSNSDASSSSSGSSDGDFDDDRVRIMRPRDTIVTPIDSATGGSESMLLSPRSRRAELRRSGARASM